MHRQRLLQQDSRRPNTDKEGSNYCSKVDKTAMIKPTRQEVSLFDDINYSDAVGSGTE